MIQISVIIPCYNVENYIEVGLESVLSQTLRPLEVICVDDGSTDQTVEKIKAIQEQNPGIIQLIINDGNKGATYTRNRGLSVARGEYIQFFDADDILVFDKFEYQSILIMAANPKPDILVGSCRKLFLDGSDKIYYYQKGADPWNCIIDAMLGVTTSNLFRKEKIVEVDGWNDSLKSSQEYDLMFRMLQKGAVVLMDEKIVSTNRERPSGSITKSNPSAKWKRFIDLRIRIYDYLKTNHLLTPVYKQTFINTVFDAVRILYLYDKETAIELHQKYVKEIGKPTVSSSTSQKYLHIYNVLGFEVAQRISSIVNDTQKRIH